MCKVQVLELGIRGCTGEYGHQYVAKKIRSIREWRETVLLTGRLELPRHHDTPQNLPPEERDVHSGFYLPHGLWDTLQETAPGPVVPLHVCLHRLHSRVDHVGRHQL